MAAGDQCRRRWSLVEQVATEGALALRRRVAQLAEGPATWAIPWPCLHEFLAIVTDNVGANINFLLCSGNVHISQSLSRSWLLGRWAQDPYL